MVRGQTVAQSHRQFQRLIRVHCFEGSTHAHQYTITGQRYLLLSDKLLELGHALHPTPMRTTEFAPTAVSEESASRLPLASSAGYGPPTFAKTWKRGRMSGHD